MTEATIDVVGIGNALVDVLVEVDDAKVTAAGMAKGGMTLVEREQSDALYETLPAGIERSGGSCGNTMAGLAALGGKGAYIGKVRDDQFGDVFRHDMTAIGVDFVASPAIDGPGTGKCLVMVTPDAQRTMVTYLGAATELTPADIDADAIQAAKVLPTQAERQPLYEQAQVIFKEQAPWATIATCTVSCSSAGGSSSLMLR